MKVVGALLFLCGVFLGVLVVCLHYDIPMVRADNHTHRVRIHMPASSAFYGQLRRIPSPFKVNTVYLADGVAACFFLLNAVLLVQGFARPSKLAVLASILGFATVGAVVGPSLWRAVVLHPSNTLSPGDKANYFEAVGETNIIGAAGLLIVGLLLWLQLPSGRGNTTLAPASSNSTCGDKSTSRPSSRDDDASGMHDTGSGKSGTEGAGDKKRRKPQTPVIEPKTSKSKK
eukprot:TRINITY_DN1716_c0_g1_i1.p1 TRINITY_DN1716_c0_g1~~TRINITY_DN1716_c0_g1_i1.p1  ORF type:complete len:230 (+),score=22.90 TRINITY_DN1716_c0_g1_i1:30-719(+)